MLCKHTFKTATDTYIYNAEGKATPGTGTRTREAAEEKERELGSEEKETEIVLWSESFSSVCLSFANEWQMLQGTNNSECAAANSAHSSVLGLD